MTMTLAWYTVVIYEREDVPLETPWTNFQAAIKFADKVYARRNVTAVKVWKGEPPELEQMPDDIQPAGLMYAKVKPG